MILSTNIFASSNRETINIYANGSPNVRQASRVNDYAWCEARCYAVYPVNGTTDTYTTIRCRVMNNSQQALTNEYKLVESNTSSTRMYFNDNYIGSTLNFYFYGNSSNAARADVYYNGN